MRSRCFAAAALERLGDLAVNARATAGAQPVEERRPDERMGEPVPVELDFFHQPRRHGLLESVEDGFLVEARDVLENAQAEVLADDGRPGQERARLLGQPCKPAGDHVARARPEPR